MPQSGILLILLIYTESMRSDLLDWAIEYFVGEHGLLQKKTFGCPSFYRGKKMFAFLYDDALGVKAGPELTTQKIKENPDVYGHFNPGDGVMGNWLMITYPEASEYDQEREMIEDLLYDFQ